MATFSSERSSATASVKTAMIWATTAGRRGGTCSGSDADPAGGIGEVLTDDGGVEPRAQVGEHVVVDRLGQLDDALLDPAGAGDQHQQQPRAATA